MVLAGVAAEVRGAEIDPEAAKGDADFLVQGEYVGHYTDSEGVRAEVGVQVIAMGKGTFQAVGYEGGLPGAGWDGGEVERADGKRGEDGRVVFEHPDRGSRGVLAGGVLSVETADGKKLGELKRVERESPTLGAKAPEGAVVLFEGKETDAWKPGARMTEDGLLMEGVNSERTNFKNFTLHIEFLLPFKPEARGQGRGNSGMFLLGSEIQMLDSFGLSGEANECGGIYKYIRPSVNMCYPPLRWQTYDVDYTAGKKGEDGKVSKARMTVRHNGVVIHDDVELDKGPEQGGIQLQNHGNPVRYRNIWLVEKG